MVKICGKGRDVHYPGHASLSVVWSIPYITGYPCIEGKLVQCLLVSSIYVRPRSCRPERYEIPRIIHATLVSHTTAMNRHLNGVTPRQELQMSDMTQELSTLVRLFDEILQEEFCSDHGTLDPTGIEQGPLTCSFCGSCLFLSCFFCRECSREKDAHLLLCVGCYIEGRSCHCDTISPIRLGNFPSALRDRNNAVGSLSRASHLHRMPTQDLTEVSER